jgi:hypothetical protein
VDKKPLSPIISKHRLDIIVIASLLLLSLLALLFITLTRKEGAAVEITVGGDVVATYSLFKNGEYELNGGTNTLVIENGVAYMDYSSCPDHVCERKGKIRYAGQTIVCLPNKLTVTIIGETDESVDFVS